MLTEGMTEGIVAGTRDVLAAAQGMADAAIVTPSPQVATSIPGGGGGADSGAAPAQTNNVYNVTIPTAATAQDVAREISMLEAMYG